MVEGSLVRVRIEGSPTPSLVRSLRHAFPSFARRPVTDLVAELRGRSRWVVRAGHVDEAQLRGVGVHVEPVSDDEYTSSYVRGHLPAPRELEDATLGLVAVLRPSFEPEVVIHAWAKGKVGELHIASREVSLWERDFVPTDQRLPDSRDEERCFEGRARLGEPARLESLVRATWGLSVVAPPNLAPHVVADGTMLSVATHVGEDRCVFEGVLVDAASEWFAGVVELARDAGLDSDFLACMES